VCNFSRSEFAITIVKVGAFERDGLFNLKGLDAKDQMAFNVLVQKHNLFNFFKNAT